MTPWGLYGAMVPQVPLIVDVLGPTDITNYVLMLLLVLEAKTGVLGAFGGRSCGWLLGPKVAIVLCTLTAAPTSDLWQPMLFFPVWCMPTLATKVYLVGFSWF